MKNLLQFLFIIIIATGCAQIESPTGGPKDVTPSKIKRSTVLNASTNFKEDEIKLRFDEFILLNNIKQEVIISPPLEEKPEFIVSGKTLKIGLNGPLKENTTYTINLGNGIKDFHEGNILDSNVFVFSTGDFIDSLELNGSVRNAFNLEPQAEHLVLLYENTLDSTPAKSPPYYYTKTNKDGDFKFTHLKEGNFQIFVLNDQNANRIYDLPNEQIGFIKNGVNIHPSLDSHLTIYSFEEPLKKQFLKSFTVVSPGKIRVVLNTPSKDVDFKIIGRSFKKQWYTTDSIHLRDTIYLWTDLQLEEKEKLDVEVWADQSILDTAKLSFPKKENKKEQVHPQLKLNTQNGIAKYFNSLIIESTEPIKHFTKHVKVIIGTQDTTDVLVKKIGSQKLKLDLKLKEEQKYKVILTDSLIIDILGHGNKHEIKSFRTKSEVEYANLKLKVQSPTNHPMILQLLSDKESIINQRSVQNNDIIHYENLSPGKYKLKIIFDENNNNKWDPGKFIPRKLSEKVIYFSDELEMKEGWDKDLTWTIPE